jgi:hypothetical protein
LCERHRHRDDEIDILVGSTRIESTQMFIHAIVALAIAVKYFLAASRDTIGTHVSALK